MRNQALDRRTLLAAAGAVLATPVFAAVTPYRITMLGDSITAGYGLRANQAVPARLEAELNRLGVRSRVTAAGVSVDFSVRPGVQLCIVALGGNDLLQGLEPKLLERNLTGIITRLKARKVAALLAGIQAPSVLGAAYARDFNAAYARVARTQNVLLHPDLLAGVSGRSDLMQRDGIHPNATGADLIARRLAPTVAKAVRSLR